MSKTLFGVMETGRFLIMIGRGAGAAYAGSAGHIIALGDGVVVPDDSPPSMLYVAGKEARKIERMGAATRALIEAYMSAHLAKPATLDDSYVEEWNRTVSDENPLRH